MTQEEIQEWWVSEQVFNDEKILIIEKNWVVSAENNYPEPCFFTHLKKRKGKISVCGEYVSVLDDCSNCEAKPPKNLRIMAKLLEA